MDKDLSDLIAVQQPSPPKAAREVHDATKKQHHDFHGGLGVCRWLKGRRSHGNRDAGVVTHDNTLNKIEKRGGSHPLKVLPNLGERQIPPTTTVAGAKPTIYAKPQ